MTLLFRIVYAAHANGTHHKLALDALHHLTNPEAEGWRRLFLQHAEVYLEGSKAPDKEFKDFKNHVLHVGDNFWGGAPEKVESWYAKLVETLKARSWHEAVWAAGIMSHYYTDPLHPFHTAQSKAENEIHRAVEWSISKSYTQLAARNKSKPPPEIKLGRDATWIKDHVIAGAERSNRHYETLIGHYDFKRGVVDPPAGLDTVCQDLVSDLLSYAAVGHARLLDRAFEEAGVSPPEVKLTAETVVAALKIPLKWVTRKMEDAADRKEVEAIYDELNSTGEVEENLPTENRQIREMHAREVLGKRSDERRSQRVQRLRDAPLPQGQIPKLPSATPKPTTPAAQFTPAPSDTATSPPTSEAHASAGSQPLSRLKKRTENPGDNIGAPSVPSLPVQSKPTPVPSVVEALEPRRSELPRPRLAPEDDLEAAPSIGPKTAARFEAIDITTVAEFLEADPETAAELIETRHITAKVIVEWQHQARLACELPGIRGGHAQLLVGAGLTSVDAIASADPGEAMAAILRYAQTSAGQSVLRDGQPPDLEEIHTWVMNAQRVKQAA